MFPSKPSAPFQEALEKYRYEQDQQITEENFDYDNRPLDWEGIPRLSPKEQIEADRRSNPYYDTIQNLSETQILFPKHPCNRAACKEYIKSLGGCEKFCSEVNKTDHYSSFSSFFQRRRSLISFFNKWPKFGRQMGLLKQGTPDKLMNCGCNCLKYTPNNSVMQEWYAKYECWTCFGKNGFLTKNLDIPELKIWDVEQLMAENRKRSITAYIYGFKKYNIHQKRI